MRYIPLLNAAMQMDGCRQQQPFQKWWDTDVLQLKDGTKFSRKQIVSHLRHEQAAHISGRFTSKDGQAASEFSRLARGDTHGWHAVDQYGNKSVPVYGQEYAAVRQIGWEVEKTLASQCADLLARPDLDSEFPMRRLPS